jgi:hypothetical protein
MDATAHRQPQPLPPVDDDDAILRQTITDVALLSLNVDAPSVAVAEAFKAAERDLDVDAVWPALAEAREGQPPPPEVDEDNNTTFRELGMVVDGKLAYVAILEDRPEPHHVPANQYDFIPMFDNLADGGGAAAMKEEEARDGPGDLPRYGLGDGAHGGEIDLDLGLGMAVHGFDTILEDRPEPRHVPADEYDFIPLFDNLADGGGAASMEEEEARDWPGDLPRYGIGDGAHGGEIDHDIGLGRVVLHGFDALLEDPPEPADQYECIAMFDKYVHEMMQEARAGSGDLPRYGLSDGAHGGDIDHDIGLSRVVLHGFDALLEDPPEPADQYESIAMFDKYVHEMMQEARAGPVDLNQYGLGDGAHGGEIDLDLGHGRVILHGFDVLMEDPPEPADQYESIAMFDKYVHEMMQEARAGPGDLNRYGLGDGAHGGEIDPDLRL